MKNHHEDTKSILNRLSRAIGHLEYVRTMVEQNRDCSEILIQIAAVKSAVNKIGNQVLKDHLLHCVLEDDSADKQNMLNEFANAINQYVK